MKTPMTREYAKQWLRNEMPAHTDEAVQHWPAIIEGTATEEEIRQAILYQKNAAHVPGQDHVGHNLHMRLMRAIRIASGRDITPSL